MALVVICVTAMAVEGVLDKTTVGAILGTVVGAVGNSAVTRQSQRSSDPSAR